jgi:hypothetical protein
MDFTVTHDPRVLFHAYARPVSYGAKNGGSLGAIPPNVQERLLPNQAYHR